MTESQLVFLRDNYRSFIVSRNDPTDVADLACVDIEMSRRKCAVRGAASQLQVEKILGVTAIEMAGDSLIQS